MEGAQRADEQHVHPDDPGAERAVDQRAFDDDVDVVEPVLEDADGESDRERDRTLLAEGWRVVAVDLSGHGDSDRRDRYSLDTWAREVLAVVAEAGTTAASVVIGIAPRFLLDVIEPAARTLIALVAR